jgi:putative ABC transport system permease protein
VLVRTQGPPEALENVVRTKVRARSTSVPMRFSTMEQSLAEYSAAPRFRTILVSGFGLIALCLAVAGIYGVLTYLVGQRTREIGLRMALGATRGTIVRMVMREGAIPAAAGTRERRPGPPTPLRAPPRFSVSFKSMREVSIAGASPNNTVVLPTLPG